eukprot:10926579-Alexandrium_andersonii.AAC.1
MSASLVGSEMCIRDSDMSGRAQVHAAASPSTAVSCARGWFPRPLLHAVSYTHLTLPTICSV